MTDYPFSQLDVFPSGPLSGNPLAVVHDAQGLTDEQMQLVARWTDLSETVFLLPPTPGAAGAHYRTRIFTPSWELPFAGHPTLGSAFAWLSTHPEHTAETVVQECGVGLVPVRRTGTGLAFAAPPLVRSGPADDATRTEVAAALNLDPAAIRAVEWVANGPNWVAVLLDDAQAVLDVRPGLVPDLVGLVGPHPPGAAYAFEVRAFFPIDGATREDPVTGSLNAGLAVWLLGSGRAGDSYVVRQGTAMGRDGRVHVERGADAAIWVGGAVRAHVQGTISL